MRTSTALLLALALLGVPLPGAALETLQVIVFPGGFNWPIWAAQERGFFARDGLEAELTPTPSSVFQLTNLIEGKFDIGMTAIDNVIAYQEGQGEAPVSGTPDLFAFMGGDNGFLRLVVQPEITGYGELRGKALSVDALTTGYAFVLRKMLERGGLRDGDYTPELAAKTYDVLLGRGFEPDAALDVEGIRTVLALRSQYGRPQKELTDPARYYDLSYYDRVRR